jgi:GT2 family glycosyltransferase
VIDLAIVIVSYNCQQFLTNCLQSIVASEAASSYSIIVVDNNSSDDTASMVQTQFPNVRFVANAQNVGFAGANNQAMSLVQSRYTMLLNPDTIVRSGAIDLLVRFLDTHENVWAAGPALFNNDGSPQRTGVRFPTNWNLLVEALFLDRFFPHSKLFGAHRELYKEFSQPREVDFVQGSCLVVRQSAIERVGLLDEQFFMYFEETDWCFRIKQAGGSVMYVPQAEIVHFGGGEKAHYDEQRVLHFHSSLFRFYAKHHTPAKGLVMKAIVALRSLIRIVFWCGVLVVKPRYRARALSTLRGYLKIFSILPKA